MENLHMSIIFVIGIILVMLLVLLLLDKNTKNKSNSKSLLTEHFDNNAKNENNNIGSGNTTATAIARLSQNDNKSGIGNGSVEFIDISYSGAGYTEIPTIEFIGECKKSAKALAIMDTGRVVGVLLIDGGLGYKTDPKVLISSPKSVNTNLNQQTESDLLNSILTGIKTIENSFTKQAGATTASTMSFATSQGTPTNTSIKNLTPAEIQEKAQEYDQMMAQNAQQTAKKQAEAKAKLVDVIEYQKKETTAIEYSKKYGLPPPPTKYTPAQIAQIKLDAKASTPRNLSTDQKAQCMLLLDDYTAKSEKVQDLGNLSADQPFLIPQVKKASDVATKAQQLYTGTCQ